MFDKQPQQQLGITPIVFLSTCLRFPDCCGMTDVARNAEVVHQLQKPSHRSGRFDPDGHGCREPRIELTHVIALVLQGLLDHLPSFVIQHRHALLARMQIATYNPHLGLLRPERCEGWTPHSLGPLRGRRRYGINK